jgi:hypothetical protein
MHVGGCETELEKEECRVAEGETGHAGDVQEGGEVEDVFVECDGGGDIADIETCFEEMAWGRGGRHCNKDLLRKGFEQFTLIEELRSSSSIWLSWKEFNTGNTWNRQLDVDMLWLFLALVV